MNSNYIGLLINSSCDILDITGNIISLNSNVNQMKHLIHFTTANER